MSVTERSFPAHCPSCKMLNAVTAHLHCPSPTCPWLRCRCGVVFTEQGSFYIMPGGADA